MNGSRQMELHYINTGFPYTITESFMDFFEGLTYAHADFAIADAFHDQVPITGLSLFLIDLIQLLVYSTTMYPLFILRCIFAMEY